MSKTKNNAIFRCNPMIASLHKRAANDLDHTLAVHLGYEWHTALLAMMEAGLGESVSIRYAANCLEAWLDQEQTDLQEERSTTIEPHVLKERMKSLDLCGPFQKIFGVRLVRFWGSNITGFDIVGFDKYLRVPKNVSLATHIQETYGQQGTELIKALMA